MSPDEYARIREVFEQVFDLPLEAQQTRIEQLCQDDFILANNVRELLSFHDPVAAESEALAVEGRSLEVGGDDGTGRFRPPLQGNLVAHLRNKFSQFRLFWNSHSLWTRALSLVLLFCLFINLIGSITLSEVHRNVIRARGAELEQLTSLVATTMRLWTAMHVSRVELVARGREARRILFAIDESARLEETEVQELGDESDSDLSVVLHNGLGESVDFILWAANGQILVSSYEDPELAMKWSSLYSNDLVKVFNGNSVLHLPRSSDLHVTGTEVFPASEQMKLAWIIVPVFDKNGRVRVALGVSKSALTSQFTELNREFDFGKSGEVISFDQLGVALSQHRITDNKLKCFDIGSRLQAKRADELTRPVDAQAPVELRGNSIDSESQMPLLVPVSKAVNGGDGTELNPFVDFQGTECIAAYRWIADLDFGVLAKLDYEEAIRPCCLFHRLLVTSYFASGCCFCAMIVSAYVPPRAPKFRFSVGDIVGSYQLQEQIGCGGMGAVFKAKHLLLERFAAIKVLTSESHDQQSRKRFDREVRVLARLCSPHTVSIFDCGYTDAGEPYFAMELLSGITLDKLVEAEGPQPVKRVLRLIAQAAEAIAEAHFMGLVHRDIKPQNLMLTQERHGTDWLVVFDFGLAKAKTGDAGLYNTDQRVWVGTPLYMAPERIRSPYLAEPASDLFSLGAVAYFLLAGREPFLGENSSSVFEKVLAGDYPPIKELRGSDVPEAVERLVFKCMDVDPLRRPQSADQLANDARALAELLPE